MRTRALITVLYVAAAACSEKAPDVSFDGARALEYVKLQVDAGPRVPNTDAHRLVGDRIVAEMKKNADNVIEQAFTHVTAKGDTLHLRNIFAQFNPAATKRILYLTHWESRPKSDDSFSDADKAKPLPGANDGASGVALFFVLAEALKATPPTIGVDLLFTDGEDWGDFRGVELDTAKNADVLIGSRYFADNILPNASYRPLFGVLWDMVGGKDMIFKRDSYSEVVARNINDRIWKLGKALGYKSKFSDDITTITDDHLPLLGKGFKIVDLCDIDYAFHHKVTDTPDKLSAESLTASGRLALALIRSEETKK